MNRNSFNQLEDECINSGLCVECGACAAICPKHAIEMKRYSWGNNPELCAECDENCDLCTRVCPARVQPLRKVEEKFFGRAANPEERKVNIGVVRDFCTGYATDTKILENAVSGGVTTALLANALKQGIIDGAVVASFDPEKPWIGKAKVVTTVPELISCAGSCYQPHPQLLGLREALDMGLRKIALTATPCAAAALRKLMLDEKFADVAGRIKVILSNFCAAHWSRFGTEWLLTEKMKLNLNDVKSLRYRARPFPGMFKVELKNGTVLSEKFVYGYLNHMGRFTPEECRYCLDKIGFNADIAVGDTWGYPEKAPSRIVAIQNGEHTDDPFLAGAKYGISQFLVRSETGEELLRSAIENGALTVCKETEETKFKVLASVQLDKSTTNSQVVAARIVRSQPYRVYEQD